jgi:hypothetical protein
MRTVRVDAPSTREMRLKFAGTCNTSPEYALSWVQTIPYGAALRCVPGNFSGGSHHGQVPGAGAQLRGTGPLP